MSDDPTQRLIDELVAEGSVAEPGEWTLDEAKARAKLARYRLADPDVWACLLVEAALLLGARAITFTIGLGSLTIQFDGEPLELGSLFGGLLGHGAPDRATRARRKLAIALETALEREPGTTIEVRSGTGLLRLARDSSTLETLASAASQTALELRRATLRWPELELVRERARYAGIAVILAGPASTPETISRGIAALLDDVGAAYRWPIVDGARTIGWFGHAEHEHEPSYLAIVSDGIVAERIPLPGRGEVAALEVSLPKDLGENHVLHGDALDRLVALAAAMRATHPRPPRPTQAGRASRAPLYLGVALGVITVFTFVLVVVNMPASRGDAGVDARADMLRATLQGEGVLTTCVPPQPYLAETVFLRLSLARSGRTRVDEVHIVGIDGDEACVRELVEARAATLVREQPARWIGREPITIDMQLSVQ